MIAIIIFIVATFICHIIAMATNYWLSSSDSFRSDFLHIGLFTACFDHYEHKHETGRIYDGCHGLYSDYYKNIQDWLMPSWLVSCRAMTIIALILLIVGAVLALILLLWIVCKCITCDDRRDCCQRFLMYATPITFVLAGVFLMSAVMIFADNAFRLQCKDFWVGGSKPNVNHLSFSWVFEIFACILSFVSAGFIIWLVVLKAREEEY